MPYRRRDCVAAAAAKGGHAGGASDLFVSVFGSKGLVLDAASNRALACARSLDRFTEAISIMEWKKRNVEALVANRPNLGESEVRSNARSVVFFR